MDLIRMGRGRRMPQDAHKISKPSPRCRLEGKGSFGRSAPFLLAPGTGGNAEAAWMFTAVLAAFDCLETDLTPLAGIELRAGESLHRTGIDAGATFAAGLVEGRARLQGSVGQDGDESNPGTKPLGQ